VELSEAVEAQIVSAAARGKVFFNKLEMFLTDPDTVRVLIRHGARVVNVWRANGKRRHNETELHDVTGWIVGGA
jgi:hypothetical protein